MGFWFVVYFYAICAVRSGPFLMNWKKSSQVWATKRFTLEKTSGKFPNCPISWTHLHWVSWCGHRKIWKKILPKWKSSVLDTRGTETLSTIKMTTLLESMTRYACLVPAPVHGFCLWHFFGGKRFFILFLHIWGICFVAQ